MGKTNIRGPKLRVVPDHSKLRKFLANLGNAYLRLAAEDRLKVMRLLAQFTFRNANTASTNWDRWSKDHLKACCLQLQPISQKMANDLRRWGSELLKTGCNNRLAARYLMDELIARTWIEKP